MRTLAYYPLPNAVGLQTLGTPRINSNDESFLLLMSSKYRKRKLIRITKGYTLKRESIRAWN